MKASKMTFSLNRLIRGVDNIRYDVHLSPNFCKTVSKIVTRVLAAHTQSEESLNLGKTGKTPMAKEKDEFRSQCREIMLDAIHKAKLRREVQIDYLAQTVIIKILLEEIRSQYERLIVHFKNMIRGNEMSNRQEEVIQLKRQLSAILENRKGIMRKVGAELFQCVAEVQEGELKEMRESNFGSDAILPDHIFSNPIFHAEDPTDGFFMIEEYDILPGRRVEDPDRVDTVISFVGDLLIQIDMKSLPEESRLGEEIDQEAGQETSQKAGQETPEGEARDCKSEECLEHLENVDILFNHFRSQEQCNLLKRQNATREDILEIRNHARKQRKLLSFFYRKFRKKGLMKRIIALYEMQPLYRDYCPPLVPRQVLQFLILPKTRKGIATRLRQLKPYYNQSFPLRPLRKVIMNLEKIDIRTRKAYLLRFLRGFIRYHRDFQNFTMLREALDSIHLATKEKMIDLSRANNTLYEFLLPHERESEEKPVISHVILKADIRGSTDVVYHMKKKGLNPATYFSLNFFDPITDILFEYDASKVCIEGDAYILSIHEREASPEGWYSVARACGLAINMLNVIRRCNAKNKKHQLPTLELGIGVTYRDTAPTIFFDGNNQIMISSAINLADRLSGCSKPLRKKLAENRGKKEPFNLHVFQSASDEEVAATADDISLRYNVNGIELSDAAFGKLSHEIDLKAVLVNIQKKRHKFHAGKFPTVNDRYQSLVIREAVIPKVDPETLEVVGPTPRKYYEVCTNPMLCEHVREAVSGPLAANR